MTELSNLIGEDSRKPIERLRRVQLWKIADEAGIDYPPGAAKDVMIKLLEALNVNVMQSAAVQWQQISGINADGTPNTEIYPIVPPHASLRNGVDANIVLTERLSKKEEEEKAFADARMDALERENQQLKKKNEDLQSVIEKRLAALEGNDPKPLKKDHAANGYWELYRKAQSLGLEVRGKKTAEIKRMIAEAEKQA